MTAQHTPWITRTSLINLFGLLSLLVLAGVLSARAQATTPSFAAARVSPSHVVSAPQNLGASLGAETSFTLAP